MTEREQLLLPVYSQISLQFADLHDRAGRMEAKHVIRHPLQWKNARRFFYWRLRRRLNEESLIKKMVGSSVKDHSARAKSLRTLRAATGVADFEHDDQTVAKWYEENRQHVQSKLDTLKSERLAADIVAMLNTNKEGGMKGLKQFLETMPVEERDEAFKYLKG